MTNQKMKDAIAAAMLPYLLAFLSKPGQASLDVFVDVSRAVSTLRLAPSDLAAIQASSAMRGNFTRSYNALCAQLDSSRIPSLKYA